MIGSTSLTAGSSTSLTAGGANHCVQIWMAAAPVDLRKSFDTLAEHVRAFLGHDPLCGHMFVFRNRTGERLKILWWDRNGLVLYYKRLEKGTFQFPRTDQKCMTIDCQQLLQLLAGSRVVQREAASI